jgi:parallel beta-helix repeat protein
MKTAFSLLLAGIALAGFTVSAAIFTITNVNDNGPGSLRQAILDANANPGADTINFSIAGSGVQTIAPTNALPDITDSVSISGYSQPGSSQNQTPASANAVILIRLDGYKITSSLPTALSFSGVGASGSSVSGLCIVRFAYGIKMSEASNVKIAGNWIGIDVDGVARGTTFEGVSVSSFFNSANNIVIGGTGPGERNVISGNRYGLYFSGPKTANCLVQGNYIGTDQSGLLPRGNLFGGVHLFNVTNITIGGSAPNLICAATGAGGTGITVQSGGGHSIIGNFIGTGMSGLYDLGNISDGIFITSSQSNRIWSNEIVNNRGNGINVAASSGTDVEFNLIGTDASGAWPLGNALAGITISGSTNRIGGLGSNRIQFNGGAGVEVTSVSAVQNEIAGNSIYDNGGLGIDLYPAGINTNDVLDADTGANGLQNYPVLTNASIVFSALSVQGGFNSKAGATYRLEFFATSAWDATYIPEGQIFLGSTNVTTDGSGNASFNAAFATAPATNLLITATATDVNGNTSEFSAGIGISTNGIASPSLSVAKGGGGGGGTATTTTVVWPSAATFFTLEKTDSLNPPVQWQAVTSGIADAGGLKTFTLTNGGVNTHQFFRLKKP